MSMQKSNSRWSLEEIQKCNNLVAKYRKNFRKIADHFETRSYSQIRAFYYNQLHKVEQQKIRPVDDQTKNITHENDTIEQLKFIAFDEL
ncbi:SANT/Myb_domain [Hexamita inflata]|uniref:SANT/Myb domain n=1 Tax=Hexamita inflata TaxID=28002 RepID=A0AA86QE14_9EUKA|nr:SANT/Myb domain [Hexamita inflata]